MRDFWLFLALAFSLSGCAGGSAPPLPPVPEALRSLGPIPQPERNPMTPEGVALGKRLFFDERLSGTGGVSCATCHLPAKAFADSRIRSTFDKADSLARNSPTLANVAYMTDGLFWDGGAKNLESLAFAPLTHAGEMAADLRETVAFLQNDEEYAALFAKAFGGQTPNSALMARALAQYQRTILSGTSRYDSAKLGMADLSPLEIEGEEIFTRQCAACHPPPLFTDNAFHNTGLDASFPSEGERPGQGRYRVTLDSADMGAFKTPTLRNLALTAPYMHDGRFATLPEALAHYDSGVAPNPYLDEYLSMRKGRLALSEKDETALLAFLLALTDSAFASGRER